MRHSEMDELRESYVVTDSRHSTVHGIQAAEAMTRGCRVGTYKRWPVQSSLGQSSLRLSGVLVTSQACFNVNMLSRTSWSVAHCSNKLRASGRAKQRLSARSSEDSQ